MSMEQVINLTYLERQCLKLWNGRYMAFFLEALYPGKCSTLYEASALKEIITEYSRGTCLKCPLNELRRVDLFTWRSDGLLLQVLTQHKLICIEVYLHSALTHSNVTFFLPASLPVWNSRGVHSLCSSRLCGNGRPAVHHTPRRQTSTWVQNSSLLQR